MRKHNSIIHIQFPSMIPDASAFVSTRNRRIARQSRQDHYYLHALLPTYSESSVATTFSLADASMGTTTTTSSAAVAIDASSPPAAVVVIFEPILPSTATLAGMGLIVILCGLVAYVWQTQVVPTSRTNLAISKSRGPLKEYLDELKQAAGDDGDGVVVANNENNDVDVGIGIGAAEERSHTTSTTIGGEEDEETAIIGDTIRMDGETMTQMTKTTGDKKSSKSRSTSSSNRALERWLFTDWLNNNKSSYKAGRQKEAALPILKDAKWNSGDNPVLAATALITLGVLLSAVTERVGTSLNTSL